MLYHFLTQTHSATLQEQIAHTKSRLAAAEGEADGLRLKAEALSSDAFSKVRPSLHPFHCFA